MASHLNPYISFNGNARQAMEFYQQVLGGNLDIRTFGEFGPEGGMPAEAANQVMHAMLQTPSGFTLMASDTPPEVPYNPGTNVSISISGEDGDELRGYWEKLSAAGTVSVPFEKQMWGDEFGACTDQFGINWMVDVVAQA